MVRVELLVHNPGNVANERARGRVVIDVAGVPPADAERVGPVVVEELESDDADQMVGELFRIARDNAAIARRMMRRQSSSVQRAD